jgi:outer membrane protein assembly factor BamB
LLHGGVVTGDLALRDSTESSQPAVSADPRLASLRTVDLLRTPFTVLALLGAGVAQDRKPDPVDFAAETPATESPDAAHDWRAFRGTDGRATSVETVPVKWGDDENIEWKCKIAGPGTSSPIVVGGAVLVTHWSDYGSDPKAPVEISNLRRHLPRIERATGKTRWRVETKTNGALAPSIIVGRDTMYSFGGQTGKRSYAVRLGRLGDVTRMHVRWASRYGSYVTTPLLNDGHLYWVNEGGILFCADVATGELVFKGRLSGTFHSSPVGAGGAIYFVSLGEGTYVVAAKSKFELLRHNRIESDELDFDATPAVSGRRLFPRSRDWLYCISNR